MMKKKIEKKNILKFLLLRFLNKMLNLFKLFIISLSIKCSYSYDTSLDNEHPMVFDNRLIIMIEQECQKAIIINLGPSVLIKDGLGRSAIANIDDYNPWIEIVKEINEKHPNFSLITRANQSIWNTNLYSCPKLDINYSVYIGVHGWNIITGIGDNIDKELADINLIDNENLKSSSSSNILKVDKINYLMIIFFNIFFYNNQ
jgi:hypothetical protein